MHGVERGRRARSVDPLWRSCSTYIRALHCSPSPWSWGSCVCGCKARLVAWGRVKALGHTHADLAPNEHARRDTSL